MSGAKLAEIRENDGHTARRFARECYRQDKGKRARRWIVDGVGFASLAECMTYAERWTPTWLRYRWIVDLETGLAFMFRDKDGGLWDLGSVAPPPVAC